MAARPLFFRVSLLLARQKRDCSKSSKTMICFFVFIYPEILRILSKNQYRMFRRSFTLIWLIFQQSKLFTKILKAWLLLIRICVMAKICRGTEQPCKCIKRWSVLETSNSLSWRKMISSKTSNAAIFLQVHEFRHDRKQ